MLNRREFLKATVLGGASCLTGLPALGSQAWAEQPADALDRAAAARALAEHRIAEMRARAVWDVFPRSLGPSAMARPIGRGGSYLVRTVITDKGVQGWAMSHIRDKEVRHLTGACVGDIFDLDEGPVPEALCLEKVLYDLAGAILQKPVYELISGVGPREVPLYSSAIYFEDLMPPGNPRGTPAVVAACKQDYDAGYRAFKLKIGRGFRYMERRKGLRRDIEVTQTVRGEFGDCRVLVDATDAYTAKGAAAYVKGLGNCDLYWIEETFVENEADLWALRQAMVGTGCKAMVADGESRKETAPQPTRAGGYTDRFLDRLLQLGQKKLVDVCLLDLGIVGFSRWRKLMPVLKEAGLKASPSTWMWTPRPYYAAHLAAGIGNIPIVEGIPGQAKRVDYSAYKMKEGKLIMPATPGFGLKLA